MEDPRDDEVEGTGLRGGLWLLGAAVALLGLRLATAPGGPGSTAGAVGAVLGIAALAALLLAAAARHPRRHALFGLAWAATLVAFLSSVSLVCGATD